jgi:NDP-sugar pyrophosphorylase family protein
VAVNVHHGRDQLEAHLAGKGVHVSVEVERALGTAGALGRLRGWLDGRATVVVNADTWCEAEVPGCLDGWDGERVRLVVAGPAELGPRSRVVASVLPWSHVRTLTEEPAELYDTTWRPAAGAGTLDVVGRDGAFFDCGAPASYLAANLHTAQAAEGSLFGRDVRVTGSVEASVVGDGCRVDGVVRSSVLWPGAVVEEGEVLDRVVRVSSTMTVAVR